MIVEEPSQVLDSCRTLIRGVVDQYKAVFYKQKRSGLLGYLTCRKLFP